MKHLFIILAAFVGFSSLAFSNPATISVAMAGWCIALLQLAMLCDKK